MKKRNPRIEITFWGVRGSVSSHEKANRGVGGHTACVAIHYNRRWMVLDAGTGIRNLGKKLEKSREPIALFLTHLHWDHIFGLPFFKPLYQRGRSILLAGPSHGRRSFKETFGQVMKPPFFPIRSSLWKASTVWKTVGAKNVSRMGGVTIQAKKVAHHDGTFGFSLLFPGGKRMIYVTDQELKPSDKKFIRWIAGADLLIHDSQYDRKRYAKRKGWGHSAFEIVLETAMAARVKRLALFHHDPDMDDRALQRRLKFCRRRIRSAGSSLKCLIAREGLSFVL